MQIVQSSAFPPLIRLFLPQIRFILLFSATYFTPDRASFPLPPRAFILQKIFPAKHAKYFAKCRKLFCGFCTFFAPCRHPGSGKPGKQKLRRAKQRLCAPQQERNIRHSRAAYHPCKSFHPPCPMQVVVSML